MDIVSAAFSYATSDNAISSLMTPIIFFILLTLLAFNRKDPQRVWVAGMFLIWVATETFILRVYLPEEVIIRQLFYGLLDVLLIWTLKYRVLICNKIFYGLNLKYDNSFIGRILTDLDATKQEYRMRQVLWLSFWLSVAMIIEHLVRHPYYIAIAVNFFQGETASTAMNDFLVEMAASHNLRSITYVYDVYPYVKTALYAAIIFALTTMSLDGLAKSINATKSKNGFNH